MSGINIKIKAGKDKDTSSIEINGTVEHIITDKEVDTFRLHEENLKNAVDKHAGKKPSDVYLHSPTPWGDLYKSYGWEQVKTILKVIKSEVLEVTSNPTIVATKHLVNTSNYPGEFNASIEESVENTTETTWSSTHTIEISQSFTYSVSFLGTGGAGTTSMSYSGSWGEGGSKSQTVTVGSSQGVTVNLEPKQSAIAELTASKGVMKVRIFYEASLSGSVAANYSKKHEGHYFWRYDISEIMGNADINNSLEFTEDIEIGYFSNARVELQNGEDNGNRLDQQEEKEEFAEADKKRSLICRGRPCAKCYQCRDWHFDGDDETWKWIGNYRDWNDEDEHRWYDESVGEKFTKREDATCKFSGYGTNDSNGYLLYGGYGVSHGNVFDHSCVCEKH